MAAQTRFVLRCPGCRAPLADSLRVCPYCGKPTSFEALGLHGAFSKTRDGGLHVSSGHLVLGAGKNEVRECPFCGAQVKAADRFCAHCKAKVVIETMWLRSLVVSGEGAVTVSEGGLLCIGVPDINPGLRDAAIAGDVARARKCLERGAEIDGVDDCQRSALHLAIANEQVEVALYLVAMGADVTAEDADRETPLHLAAARGLDTLARALGGAGASLKARNRKKQTPSKCAVTAGHAALALQLK